jgi:S1-C subfamily serine protease
MKLEKWLLMLLLALPSWSTAADYSGIRQTVYPVIVHAPSGVRHDVNVTSGSAVVLDKGYALTAAHVVPTSSRDEMIVITSKGSVKAVPVKIDRERDLALLSVDVSCPCAELAQKPIYVDDQVWDVGYPMYLTYDVQFVTIGTVQGWYRGNIVATSMSAPGGSGGGLFAKEGKKYKLVGISVAIATAPTGSHFFNGEQERNWMMFSVPITTIRSFLVGTPVANR